MQIKPYFHAFLGWNATGDLGDLTAYTATGRATVWFEKTPPKKPPSYHQIVNRNRFRAIAQAWRNLPDSKRANWLLAAETARLSITGYALFVYWMTTHREATIRTIEHQSGVTLL